MTQNQSEKNRKRIVVAICGASGAIYGVRLIEALSREPVEIFLVVSDAGKKVLGHETGYAGGAVLSFLKKRGLSLHERASLKEYDRNDLFAPPASGSFRHDGMVVAPCSMNTLGAVASGIADDLVRRAADVTLKEKRTLILLTRETPLSAIHLENMLRLSRAGATIMPACPGFYNRPVSVEDLVDSVTARILDHLRIEHKLMKPWGEEGGSPAHV